MFSVQVQSIWCYSIGITEIKETNEKAVQVLVVVTPKLLQYGVVKDYLRDPSEVLLLTLNLAMNRVINFVEICKLREWREINNNIAVYNDTLFVFGGNPSGTIECVKKLSSGETYAEPVNFAGPPQLAMFSNLIGLMIY